MKIRYIHCRSQQKNFRQPILVWYKMQVRSDLAGIATFFAHRVPHKPTMWTVSEEISGARIGGEHVTRHGAMDAARAKLQSVTVDEFQNKRRKAIEFLECPVVDLPDLTKADLEPIKAADL